MATSSKTSDNDNNKKLKTSGTVKRDQYLSWDDYFMSVAFLSSMRSKDPSTQVGACIVNDENRIVGIGYNAEKKGTITHINIWFPTGCSDDLLPWDRSADSPLDTKYMYVVHAEMNAILNKNSSSVSGARMYVALFPCNECAKLIIQSGIREVVFLSDKYHDQPAFIASRRMFDMAKVITRQHTPKENKIIIDFSSVSSSSSSTSTSIQDDDIKTDVSRKELKRKDISELCMECNMTSCKCCS